MLWHGNECGRKKSNENFKTTIPSKNCNRPKQLENVASFKYLGSILGNEGRCTCENKCRFAKAKAASNKKRALFISTLDLEMRTELVKFYIWIIALYSAEIRTIRAVDQKHMESFEMEKDRSCEK